MPFSWSQQKKPIIGLSPMADMTDGPFCHIVREVLAKSLPESRLVIFREMVSSQAIVRGNEKTLRMTAISDRERPIIQQIFGSDGNTMAKAAHIIEQKNNPEGIDINMGCPMPKITKTGSGSALMKYPKKAAHIVSLVKKAVNIPVSVKMRTGWSDNDECIEFARTIEYAGADLITIHGRTTKQGYSGKAITEPIAKIASKAHIPILYNGDICSAQDYSQAIEKTCCDGALIGRGALGNPWIFLHIEQLLDKKPCTEISLKERAKVAMDHLDKHIEHYGQDKLPTFRKHLSWYFKGIEGSKPYRHKMMKATDKQTIQSAIHDLLTFQKKLLDLDGK